MPDKVTSNVHTDQLLITIPEAKMLEVFYSKKKKKLGNMFMINFYVDWSED